jgi:hypothetical protein
MLFSSYFKFKFVFVFIGVSVCSIAFAANDPIYPSLSSTDDRIVLRNSEAVIAAFLTRQVTGLTFDIGPNPNPTNPVQGTAVRSQYFQFAGRFFGTQQDGLFAASPNQPVVQFFMDTTESSDSTGTFTSTVGPTIRDPQTLPRSRITIRIRTTEPNEQGMAFFCSFTISLVPLETSVNQAVPAESTATSLTPPEVLPTVILTNFDGSGSDFIAVDTNYGAESSTMDNLSTAVAVRQRVARRPRVTFSEVTPLLRLYDSNDDRLALLNTREVMDNLLLGTEATLTVGANPDVRTSRVRNTGVVSQNFLLENVVFFQSADLIQRNVRPTNPGPTVEIERDEFVTVIERLSDLSLVQFAMATVDINDNDNRYQSIVAPDFEMTRNRTTNVNVNRAMISISVPLTDEDEEGRAYYVTAMLFLNPTAQEHSTIVPANVRPNGTGGGDNGLRQRRLLPPPPEDNQTPSIETPNETTSLFASIYNRALDCFTSMLRRLRSNRAHQNPGRFQINPATESLIHSVSRSL